MNCGRLSVYLNGVCVSQSYTLFSDGLKWKHCELCVFSHCDFETACGCGYRVRSADVIGYPALEEVHVQTIPRILFHSFLGGNHTLISWPQRRVRVRTYSSVRWRAMLVHDLCLPTFHQCTLIENLNSEFVNIMDGITVPKHCPNVTTLGVFAPKFKASPSVVLEILIESFVSVWIVVQVGRFVTVPTFFPFIDTALHLFIWQTKFIVSFLI